MTQEKPSSPLVAAIATALHDDLMFGECVYSTKRRIPAPECDLWDDHTRQANSVLAAMDACLMPSQSAPQGDLGERLSRGGMAAMEARQNAQSEASS